VERRLKRRLLNKNKNRIELTERQPLGFRESVGETKVRDLTAAVAHTARWVP